SPHTRAFLLFPARGRSEPAADTEAQVADLVAAAINGAQVFQADKQVTRYGHFRTQAKGYVRVVFAAARGLRRFNARGAEQAVGAYLEVGGELAAHVGAVEAVNFDFGAADLVVIHAQCRTKLEAEGVLGGQPGAELELQGGQVRVTMRLVWFQVAEYHVDTGKAGAVAEQGRT